MTVGRIKHLSFSEGVNVTASPESVSGQKFSYDDEEGWDGSAKTVTYDVSEFITDATQAIWSLKDAGNNYKQLVGVSIDHFPTNTDVRITVGVALPAGTYRLVGIF